MSWGIYTLCSVVTSGAMCLSQICSLSFPWAPGVPASRVGIQQESGLALEDRSLFMEKARNSQQLWVDHHHHGLHPRKTSSGSHLTHDRLQNPSKITRPAPSLWPQPPAHTSARAASLRAGPSLFYCPHSLLLAGAQLSFPFLTSARSPDKRHPA